VRRRPRRGDTVAPPRAIEAVDLMSINIAVAPELQHLTYWPVGLTAPGAEKAMSCPFLQAAVAHIRCSSVREWRRVSLCRCVGLHPAPRAIETVDLMWD